MWYLFIQIRVWLLAALALGWSVHWFLCSQGRDAEKSDKNDNSLGLMAWLATADTETNDS